MGRKLLLIVLLFFLFSNLAFTKGNDSAVIKKPATDDEKTFYIILAEGKFRQERCCDGSCSECLENCQVIEFRAKDIPIPKVYLFYTEDDFGNEICLFGATGIDNLDDAFRTRDSMCCCED